MTSEPSAPARLAEIAADLEPRLAAAVASMGAPEALQEAVAYPLLGAGKRLRPALVMTGSRLLGGEDACAWPGAMAVEMIHTYSLVHDDLPCMDDDDLRRGRPTVHKVYGDAMAVLVGDALQTLAFGVLAEGPAPAAATTRAVAELARAAGGAGMVGGQILDLAAEGESPELERVPAIHERKPAALLAGSVTIGGILGGADAAQARALHDFGTALGLAFQIVDDCLDETSTAAELGKSPGKDREVGKSTWPACVGVEASMTAARRLADEANAALRVAKGVEKQARFLEDLASFVVDRRV